MKLIFPFFLSIFCGCAVSSGFIAFIALIGILPKLGAKTQTAEHIKLYESMATFGVILGNIVFLYATPLPFHKIGLFFSGCLFGIFTGCLAGALAEVVNIIPIIGNRLHLHKGLPYVITSIALGKTFGTLVQWYLLKN